MKYFSVILGIILVCLSSLSHAQSEQIAAEQCIAQHSGSDSLICLERILAKTDKKIKQASTTLVQQLKQAHQNENLSTTHYQQAVRALGQSQRTFNAFSQQYCEFKVGVSGAVASGSSQIYQTCRIALNEWHLQQLRSRFIKTHTAQQPTE